MAVGFELPYCRGVSSVISLDVVVMIPSRSKTRCLAAKNCRTTLVSCSTSMKSSLTWYSAGMFVRVVVEWRGIGSVERDGGSAAL